MTDTDGASAWGFPNAATPPGSSAYYGVRFAPLAQRDALAALLAWRHQVRAVLFEVSDRGVAARKLAWWQEEIEAIHDGGGQHPLARPLGALIRASQLPLRCFTDVLWSAEAILNGRRVADVADLMRLAEQDLGAVFELVQYQAAAERRGGARPASDGAHRETTSERVAAARRAGAYCALVELIRGSGRLLRHGHQAFLPEDRRARLPDRIARGSPAAALAPLFADLEQDLAHQRSVLGPALTRLPVSTRIRVRLADALLAELRDSEYRVADQHITLTPLRKLWIAWRESRRCPED